MDASDFAGLVRSLGRRHTRRSAVASLLVGVLAIHAAGDSDGESGKCRGARKRRGARSKETRAERGGGVFNQGELTVSGGSAITANIPDNCFETASGSGCPA